MKDRNHYVCPEDRAWLVTKALNAFRLNAFYDYSCDEISFDIKGADTHGKMIRIIKSIMDNCEIVPYYGKPKRCTVQFFEDNEY